MSSQSGLYISAIHTIIVMREILVPSFEVGREGEGGRGKKGGRGRGKKGGREVRRER